MRFDLRWQILNSKFFVFPLLSLTLFLIPCLLFFIQVKVGDTLDLVLSENKDKNTVTLMRVIPQRVFGESSTTEKYKVSIRRWKNIELSKDEAFKPWTEIGQWWLLCLYWPVKVTTLAEMNAITSGTELSPTSRI